MGDGVGGGGRVGQYIIHIQSKMQYNTYWVLHTYRDIKNDICLWTVRSKANIAICCDICLLMRYLCAIYFQSDAIYRKNDIWLKPNDKYVNPKIRIIQNSAILPATRSGQYGA